MKNPFEYIFIREPHVCPWWCCFTFVNPVRKLIHDPVKILSPFVKEGDSVIDIGPGMGYFTVPLCELVGNKGRVLAVDIQQKMLDALTKRAKMKGIIVPLATHLASQMSLGVSETADFVLAFWMVHEVPHKKVFFSAVKAMMKPNGRFLLVEPLLHVSKSGFCRTVELANAEGLKAVSEPVVRFSRAVLFSA
jgi:ubiquinone/menaquinone biosynthesis C-methylase UbiE